MSENKEFKIKSPEEIRSKTKEILDDIFRDPCVMISVITAIMGDMVIALGDAHKESHGDMPSDAEFGSAVLDCISKLVDISNLMIDGTEEEREGVQIIANEVHQMMTNINKHMKSQ